MRITSLGYNPINQIGQINQNYKSKQQNTPAFNGKISITVENIEKMPWIDTLIDNILGPYISSKTGGALVEAISHDLGNKETLVFDKSFDQEASEMVSRLNKKCAEKNISGVLLEFFEGE